MQEYGSQNNHSCKGQLRPQHKILVGMLLAWCRSVPHAHRYNKAYCPIQRSEFVQSTCHRLRIESACAAHAQTPAPTSPPQLTLCVLQLAACCLVPPACIGCCCCCGPWQLVGPGCPGRLHHGIPIHQRHAVRVCCCCCCCCLGRRARRYAAPTLLLPLLLLLLRWTLL